MSDFPASPGRLHASLPAGPALEALGAYKRRDGSKGRSPFLPHASTQVTIVLWVTQPIVIVRFRAVGNAPIMKQNFYKITASNPFQTVIQFLRKELGWKPTDPLVSNILPPPLIQEFPLIEPHRYFQFTYINMAFSPAPDDTVNNLFKVCH